MKIYKAIDGFILTLKVISVLFFSSIFLYWSINAIIKYRSKPTLSTVAYKFGDDGHGNFEFPAITICLDTFNWITLSPGMKNNCTRPFWEDFFPLGKGVGIKDFYDALLSCTAKNDQTQISQKRRKRFSFPEIPGGNNDIYHYRKLEDLLQVTKLVEVTDIVSYFMFAKHSRMNISANSKEESSLMKQLWEPTLHFEKGICYTFDPKLHGKFQANPERLLSTHIDFDVSELLFVCIYYS